MARDYGLYPVLLNVSGALIENGINPSDQAISFVGEHSGIEIPQTVFSIESMQSQLTISFWKFVVAYSQYPNMH